MGDRDKNKGLKYHTLNTACFTFKEVASIDKLILPLYLIRILLSVGLDVLSIYFFPTLVRLLENNEPMYKLIQITILFIALMFIASTGSKLAYQLYWPRMSRVREVLSQRLDEIMLSIPYDQFEDPNEQNKFQNANSVISTSNRGIEGMLIHSFNLLNEIITFAIFLSISFFANYYIFAFIIAGFVINFYLTARVNKKNYVNNVEMAPFDRQLQFLNRGMIEDSHAKDMRSYHMFPWFFYRIKKAVEGKEKLIEKNEKNNFALSIAGIVIDIVNNSVIYAVLILNVFQKKISISEFSLNFSIVMALTGHIHSMLDSITQMKAFNLALNDYRQLLDMRKGVLFSIMQKTDQTLPPDQTRVKIEFKDVSFQYPNTGIYVIRHFSLVIHPGERISLVGENGAGKSTIVKLLCRLYQPTEGAIYINGKDYLEYDAAAYSRLLSVVFQDTLSYAFTIAENVSMRPENLYDGERVVEALKQSDLYENVLSFPRPEQSYLDKRFSREAEQLSGGEQQKLAISRALYKDAPIMILDEPTAALDAFVESSIYQTFYQMTKNKTTLFISHRLASAKFCDKVVLLRNGEISECGTHAQLMDKDGDYAELFRIQAEGYL